MIAVDTNILIYAHDPRDSRKQDTALSILKSLTDGALLWQVACEFVATSRKLEPFGLTQTQARQEIQTLRRVWTCLLPSWDVLEQSNQLTSQYNLSFWDSMIIAACLEAGVERLFSEDFDGYPKIGNMEIVNPFKP
jgi:predicted nucleic acid-binding protein